MQNDSIQDGSDSDPPTFNIRLRSCTNKQEYDNGSLLMLHDESKLFINYLVILYIPIC